MISRPWGTRVAWFLMLVTLAVNIAGYAFALYSMVWWFDRVLHAFTIFSITFWLAVITFGKALNPDGRQRLLSILLLAAVGIALGAVWEVAEWALNEVMPADVIKGKYDTILDIIMDTFGATFAGWAALGALRAPAPTGRAP